MYIYISVSLLSLSMYTYVYQYMSESVWMSVCLNVKLVHIFVTTTK